MSQILLKLTKATYVLFYQKNVHKINLNNKLTFYLIYINLLLNTLNLYFSAWYSSINIYIFFKAFFILSIILIFSKSLLITWSDPKLSLLYYFLALISTKTNYQIVEYANLSSIHSSNYQIYPFFLKLFLALSTILIFSLSIK